MRGKWLLLVILVMVFSGGRMALAHEGDKMTAPSTSQLNGNGDSGNSMEGMDMSGGNTDSHDMEGMDMSGDHNDGHDMEGMDMEESGHSHGPVKETPPNAQVLGTYGAVNASFILIGIWTKWFRRKGDTNGNSK